MNVKIVYIVRNDKMKPNECCSSTASEKHISKWFMLWILIKNENEN